MSEERGKSERRAALAEGGRAVLNALTPRPVKVPPPFVPPGQRGAPKGPPAGDVAMARAVAAATPESAPMPRTVPAAGPELVLHFGLPREVVQMVQVVQVVQERRVLGHAGKMPWLCGHGLKAALGLCGSCQPGQDTKGTINDV